MGTDMDASVTSGPKIKIPECVITDIFSSHFQTTPQKILVYFKQWKHEELLKARGSDDVFITNSSCLNLLDKWLGLVERSFWGPVVLNSAFSL